ncbi:DUF4079 domain-containing protein [Cyanobium gracile]|uniref:DUF4079 domain-containing protein n=1 Tax=Cyanobium gracile UHCC 0281 TaxID=3110309 RepID=A0ABU5STL6_9CYAN|nr:DUF4079 domain-containing protein [Cyanobium gracile]MEA5441806.1 DUF4079 domain-containing protein [Cyanobium gracile UHCC 0281]
MPFALNFVHPVLMWVLLGLMLYSGYLGFKASQIRKVSPEERKAMVPLRYGPRHAQLGAVILGLTLLGAAGGLGATVLKNGKLILGPHLFAGLAVVVLVIATASLGPSLQKGKDWARSLHITLNGLVLVLFGWQAFTGIAIVQKLLDAGTAPA